MTLGPIAVNETCDKLQAVMVEAVKKYKMNASDAIDLVHVFLMGWTAVVLDSLGELDDEEMKQYVYHENDVSMDIPDNLEGVDDETA